jgi:hypothetical protein
MNTILSNLIDNDVIVYSLCTVTICLITGFYIKSYFYSSIIEIPNSPPTFNFSLDQLKEIENQSEQESHKELSVEQIEELEDKLDKEEELDDIFKEILNEEEFKQYQSELLNPDVDFSDNLQDIFDKYDLFF